MTGDQPQPSQEDSVGDRVLDAVENAADLAGSAVETAASTCFVVDLFEDAFDDVCYVATAVHGNLDAPEVVLLRRYRDQRLMRTRAGRGFIAVYYRIGPFGAAVINRFPRLRVPARRVLTPVVWWARRSIGTHKPN